MAYQIRITCLKFSLLALFLLFLQAAQSQLKKTQAPSIWPDLDEALTQKQKLLGDNVVCLVWKGDSLLYKKEMGEFNAKTQAPIASCSKWLTAALVMIFVDEGKIALDDPVVKYIPEFEKYRKNFITIRHCLSHMTGIEDEGGLLKKLFQRKKFESLADEVNSFAAREIRDNAGNDFWYGNIGLNIAARVLEIVSKRKFDLLIKQKLFNPLGMRRTSFSTMDGSLVNPSGGAQSTADDYMRFLVMLMNKGKFNGVQVISENSVNEMMKVQTNNWHIKYAPKAAEGYNYALGSWVMEEKPDPEATNQKGIALALASPGLLGTWPMIDFCRGYAYIVFVKNLLGEQRADAHKELKKIIDSHIESNCK